MPKAIKSLILRLTHFKNYANIIKSLSWGREITAGFGWVLSSWGEGEKNLEKSA